MLLPPQPLLLILVIIVSHLFVYIVSIITGGYIKNALLSALSAVLSKTSATGKVVVSQEDLHAGAQLQLRGRLRMKAFDRRIVPIAGLEAVQAAPAVIEALREIVNFEKAKGLLLRFF